MADCSLICPADDSSAQELSAWCTALINGILLANHEVAYHLHPGPDADRGSVTRDSVATALEGVRCVLFFGHGKEAELTGAFGTLVDAGNVGLARGAIFVAIACSSAKLLGPGAILRGIEAYLGFRDIFAWVSRDPDRQFGPTVTSGVSKLLTGGDARNAKDEMYEGFGSVIEYYRSGNGKTSPNRAIGYLTAFWDQQHLELLGSSSARL